MEPSSVKRETVERLAEEFVERYRRGERPPLSEYTERYPEHAEQIRTRNEAKSSFPSPSAPITTLLRFPLHGSVGSWLRIL